jgi:hypothetical protein
MKMVRSDPSTGEMVEYDDGQPGPVPTYLCPCCGYKTLSERGGYEICPVCFWEDGQGDEDADIVGGGPNAELSLAEARKNFLTIGACEEAMLPHVRPPNDAEKQLIPHKDFQGER